MNIAIVGCGLIGQKRLRALGEGHKLIAVADTVLERAQQLAAHHPHVLCTTDWQGVITRREVEIVLIATTNNGLAPITLAAIQAGKHVLVEKPAALRPEELDPIISEVRRRGVCVQVGFNHRFHPALQKAREIVESKEMGPLMFIRGRYGHGGRLGYEREWRCNPEIAGGGELIDQGVHLIDLSRWFLGDFHRVEGSVATYFWNAPVEDNAFLMLTTKSDQTAWLHVSCTEWKNLFSFEIYGRKGKLHVEGLGGSYGTERLSYYRMLPQMGPPETTIWEYPGEDLSWKREFEAFLRSIRNGSGSTTSLCDAKAALEVVHQLYRGSNR